MEDVIFLFLNIANLINKRHGSRTLIYTIWPPNHTSHKKNYFNEVVANALRDNIGRGHWTAD